MIAGEARQRSHLGPHLRHEGDLEGESGGLSSARPRALREAHHVRDRPPLLHPADYELQELSAAVHGASDYELQELSAAVDGARRLFYLWPLIAPDDSSDCLPHHLAGARVLPGWRVVHTAAGAVQSR